MKDFIRYGLVCLCLCLISLMTSNTAQAADEANSVRVSINDSVNNAINPDSIKIVTGETIDLEAVLGSNITPGCYGGGTPDDPGRDWCLQTWWFFGDGTYGSKLTEKHSYRTPGTYTVGLYLWDTAGALHTDILKVNVTVAPDYEYRFLGTQTSVKDYYDFYAPSVLEFPKCTANLKDKTFVVLFGATSSYSAESLLDEPLTFATPPDPIATPKKLVKSAKNALESIGIKIGEETHQGGNLFACKEVVPVTATSTPVYEWNLGGTQSSCNCGAIGGFYGNVNSTACDADNNANTTMCHPFGGNSCYVYTCVAPAVPPADAVYEWQYFGTHNTISAGYNYYGNETDLDASIDCPVTCDVNTQGRTCVLQFGVDSGNLYSCNML